MPPGTLRSSTWTRTRFLFHHLQRDFGRKFLTKTLRHGPGQGSSSSTIHNDYCRQGQGFGSPFINCKDFFAVKIHSNLFAYFDVVDPQMSEMNFFIICKDILQQRAIFKNRYYCTDEVDAQVRAQMSEMISVTSEFHISWNSVMIASPQTILLDPRYSRSYHYIISFYHITSCMSRYV